MKISVVIPTCNRAHTLAAALDSVLNQSLAPDEVIVIDDGSTDNTASLLSTYGDTVTTLYQENHGVSHARNVGIVHAKGEWIALLDSDDHWLPDKLKQQFHLVEQHPTYRICHTDEIWIRNGVRVNQMKKHTKYGGNIYCHCLPGCVISPSSVMIHRDLFALTGNFDESLPACEDYDLWLRICADHPVLYVNKPLVAKFGGHDDQLSRRYWGMDRFRVIALEKMIRFHQLSTENYQRTLSMLLEKISIILTGAYKRENRELGNCYRQKQKKYLVMYNRITDCQSSTNPEVVPC